MLKDRSHDRTVHRSLYKGNGGTGGTKGIMDNYLEKMHAAHNKVMREATNGLVGFDSQGNIQLTVDPEKYRNVSNG